MQKAVKEAKECVESGVVPDGLTAKVPEQEKGGQGGGGGGGGEGREGEEEDQEAKKEESSRKQVSARS